MTKEDSKRRRKAPGRSAAVRAARRHFIGRSKRQQRAEKKRRPKGIKHDPMPPNPLSKNLKGVLDLIKEQTRDEKAQTEYLQGKLKDWKLHVKPEEKANAEKKKKEVIDPADATRPARKLESEKKVEFDSGNTNIHLGERILYLGRADPGDKGVPLPPFEAYSPSDETGMWDLRDGSDWRGFGLQRNGTDNRFANETACQDQCQQLDECRIAMYDRLTKNCWLDSKMGGSPRPCPKVNNSRSCVSFFKKMRSEDMHNPFGYAQLADESWHIIEQQNWKGDVGLVSNGFRNIFPDETACQKQCAETLYCRIAIYFRSTGECWLSSQVRSEGAKCAMRHNRRDCVSFIKRPVESMAREASKGIIKEPATMALTPGFPRDSLFPPPGLNLTAVRLSGGNLTKALFDLRDKEKAAGAISPPPPTMLAPGAKPPPPTTVQTREVPLATGNGNIDVKFTVPNVP